MRHSRQDRTQFKELLREFYQIHDTTQQKHEGENQKQIQSDQEGMDQFEKTLNDDNKNTMRTMSTETQASKSRVLWEEQSLKKIQEKSEHSDNSGYSSIEDFAFKQKCSSPYSSDQNKTSNQKLKTKGLNEKKISQVKKERRKKNWKRKQSLNKSKDQLFAALKYKHEYSTKTYYVGLKHLNKAWFEALDNIHKNI